MVVTKIICDRCGADINMEHPPRLQIQEYNDTVVKATDTKGYKVAGYIHFCPECDAAFRCFMENVGGDLNAQ